MIKNIIINVIASMTLVFYSAANVLAADSMTKKEIVIGTSVGDFGDMVKQSIRPMLEKQGYRVRLIEFTDYVRPNIALQEGSLDVNIFQHKPYLDTFSKLHRLSLIPVFQVPTAPLAIYAGKRTTLTEVNPGTTVALPNDPTNFARALGLLNELGWIKLKQNLDPLTASERDIADNVKKIKILALEAAQLPRARADADFVIINGNYATSAGIKLTSALYQQKSQTYINWGVIRRSDVNAHWVKELVAAYHSNEFKSWAKQKYAGYQFPQGW